MRVAQHDARSHADQSVHEEKPTVKQLLEDKHGALRLSSRHESYTHQVRGKGGPYAVVNLGHRIVHIIRHLQLLPARHAYVVAVHFYLHPQLIEDEADHLHMLRYCIAYPQLAARDSRQADKTAYLDMVRNDGMLTAVQRGHPIYRQSVRADAAYPRPQPIQHVAEVLHVWLGSSV